MKDLNFKEYSKLYDYADNEILDLTSSRKLYVCLYNDSILDDEKNYYKAKIDVIDSKVNYILETQNLILKWVINKHKYVT